MFVLITIIFYITAITSICFDTPPHLPWWYDYSTSSALDREGEFRLWPLGAMRLLAQLPTCSSHVGWCLLFYRRAYLE